jgi:hypothetical protein
LSRQVSRIWNRRREQGRTRWCVETLYNVYDGSKHRPSPRLKQMRDAGSLVREARTASKYEAAACLLTLPPNRVAFSIDVSS